MNNRIKNSIAFRSGLIYYIILKFIFIRKKKIKPKSEINLLIMTGKKQIPLLIESIYSLYFSCEKLPEIYIFSDGSVSLEDIANKLKWYPNPIILFHKDSCVAYHEEKNRYNLISFAKNNPMGLKLAAILQVSAKKKVIYCDTDVLYFKDIKPLFANLEKVDSDYLSMSIDYQQSYVINLMEKYFNILNQKPYFCAGILLIYGDLYNKLENIILEYCIENSNHFTEQTIFAGINKLYYNNSIDKTKVVSFDYDKLSINPTFINKDWIIRHYVSPVRHLFWRDAFFIRLGFR